MEKQIKKLQLNKETIAQLTNDQQKNILGGEGEDKITFSLFNWGFCIATAIAVNAIASAALAAGICTQGNCDLNTWADPTCPGTGWGL